jgi:ParB family transcriptional regulator, chromosome partitioning protein
MATNLSLKERAKLIGKNIVVADDSDSEDPTTVPGMTAMRVAQSQELKKELERLKGERGVNLIQVDQLYEVEGRRRSLSEDEYAALRDNLRKNPLITPITISKRNNGGWNIISGNNRVAIYRELGIKEIPAYEMEIKDGEGDVKAFYANLLHPSLPDFEKFRRFKIRMEETGMSAREMAAESGIKEDAINALMTFSRLPKEALNILTDNPWCVGVNAVRDFAKIAGSGRAKQVVEAITLLATNKEVTQSAAIKLALSDPKQTSEEKQKPTINIFKLGRMKFAQVRGIQNDIRISCENQEDRAELQKKIEALIKAHIDEMKA